MKKNSEEPSLSVKESREGVLSVPEEELRE
jgi:hypothetical protein